MWDGRAPGSAHRAGPNGGRTAAGSRDARAGSRPPGIVPTAASSPGTGSREPDLAADLFSPPLHGDGAPHDRRQVHDRRHSTQRSERGQRTGGEDMRCQVIVLINLSTLDSKQELDENRISLKRKYEARGQKCIEVDLPSGSIPNLKALGSVGVYVLSHTKDVKPAALAATLFDQLIAVGADVRKINIACCKASADQGPMKPFCTELVKCQTDTLKLPNNLMVCGFNINVTTFDSRSPFMDLEGKKFENYQALKEQAQQHDRDIATVKQAWAPSGSGQPNYLYFVHEKMGRGQTPAFIEEAEKLFREQLAAEWSKDRVDYINTKFNPNQKASKKILDPANWSWSDFAGTHPKDGDLYIKKVFWPKFLTCIRGVNHRSAAMWVSLDGYIRMKTVMKFNGKNFTPVALSEYAENEDMKQALSFVEGAGNKSGTNLRFTPDL
ncbi:MAG TPA: hypothetical protein VFQ38_19280 [Longimicrobiales bacterium]|nr:hypothetical protein [Longimicrobiales bacterium]